MQTALCIVIQNNINMSTAFQRTFGHLVAANAVLNDDPPPPPLHPAPTTNNPSSTQPTPSPPTDTSIKIIQGRTLTSKPLLNAGFLRNSRDGNPLTDGRQAWPQDTVRDCYDEPCHWLQRALPRPRLGPQTDGLGTMLL